MNESRIVDVRVLVGEFGEEVIYEVMGIPRGSRQATNDIEGLAQKVLEEARGYLTYSAFIENLEAMARKKGLETFRLRQFLRDGNEKLFYVVMPVHLKAALSLAAEVKQKGTKPAVLGQLFGVTPSVSVGSSAVSRALKDERRMGEFRLKAAITR